MIFSELQQLRLIYIFNFNLILRPGFFVSTLFILKHDKEKNKQLVI